MEPGGRRADEHPEAHGYSVQVHAGRSGFYGPKIDVKLVDAIGRPWQLTTVQFDFNLPRRFGLEYAGADGKLHTPVMVHRALFGSIERFFGVLIEHYTGAFPVWLAPVQAVVLPISDKHAPMPGKLSMNCAAPSFAPSWMIAMRS
jgi:threonyl-tRNA synthetase